MRWLSFGLGLLGGGALTLAAGYLIDRRRGWRR